jgi:hypothetical protein
MGFARIPFAAGNLANSTPFDQTEKLGSNGASGAARGSHAPQAIRADSRHSRAFPVLLWSPPK